MEEELKVQVQEQESREAIASGTNHTQKESMEQLIPKSAKRQSDTSNDEITPRPLQEHIDTATRAFGMELIPRSTPGRPKRLSSSPDLFSVKKATVQVLD